jgi:hypothetical protein
MYHPYLRGKQYELILLRENAQLVAESNFVPIIEPVKQNVSSLNKAIESLKSKNANFILIVNPKHGDYKNDPLPIFKETIVPLLNDYENCCLGYIVDADSSLIDIKSFLDDNQDKRLAFIHSGFPKAKELSDLIQEFSNVQKHLFIDNQSGKLYQRQFRQDGIQRVLIRDGFKKNKNRDYPDQEHFSDLHITYTDEGMDGFGDYLTVGDDYSESGGPAYAIAIHLTYIESDDDMYIRHFISDRVNTPADPAGKFLEALEKVVNTVEEEGSLILKSSAYGEFKKFYDDAHFPGLGYVKKLSMQHHFELISNFQSK